MNILFRPKKSPSPPLRRVLKQFFQCLKQYEDPKNDIAYWYGERALTGLLASASWMTHTGWSLEEFTGLRRKSSRKNGSGKGDLWLGSGGKEYTIEQKFTWPTQVSNVSRWKTTVNKKLSRASSQLEALALIYRCGKPLAVCYVVPAIPLGKKVLTNKSVSTAMKHFAEMMTKNNAHTEVIGYWLDDVKLAPQAASSKKGKRYAYPGVAIVVRYRDRWRFPSK